MKASFYFPFYRINKYLGLQNKSILEAKWSIKILETMFFKLSQSKNIDKASNDLTPYT
jgi:hypothetical protein